MRPPIPGIERALTLRDIEDTDAMIAALDDKVVVFEKTYLRAGVKHYPSRKQWARIARQEWARSGQEPAPMPAERKKDILVDEADPGEKPRVLFYLEHSLQDASPVPTNAPAGGGQSGTGAIGCGTGASVESDWLTAAP